MKVLEPMRIPLAGVALIEASAGTGKTYTVETIYLRLLLERRLGVERILVVTYTNAAAAELRGRIRDRIAVARRVLEGGADDERGEWVDWLRARRGGHGDEDRIALLRATYDLDRAAIFTIHAFCQRVLQDLAFQSGAAYGTELISDQTAILDEVVRDFWVRELHDAPPEVVSLLGKELKQLRGLARIAASQPDLAFVPPVGAVPAVTELFAAWRESRDVAARLLAAERDRVVELVVRAKTVRAASARPWTDDLAVALASPAPYVGKSFKYLDRFSARAAANLAVLPAHPFFNACADLCEREEELRAALAERRLQLRHRLVDFVRRELRRRKEEDNVAYFDDLLQSVAAALCGGRGEALAAELRQRYPTALIDEFQDTDPAQYEIFSHIYGAPAGAEAPALFLVGDPKQAIYGFRGADVFAYTRAKASLAGETTSLPVNRRSTRPLIAAVNEVFSRAARGGHSAFLVAGIEFAAVRAGDAPPPELRVPDWGALTFLHHPHGGKRRLAKEEARRAHLRRRGGRGGTLARGSTDAEERQSGAARCRRALPHQSRSAHAAGEVARQRHPDGAAGRLERLRIAGGRGDAARAAGHGRAALGRRRARGTGDFDPRLRRQPDLRAAGGRRSVGGPDGRSGLAGGISRLARAVGAPRLHAGLPPHARGVRGPGDAVVAARR